MCCKLWRIFRQIPHIFEHTLHRISADVKHNFHCKLVSITLHINASFATANDRVALVCNGNRRATHRQLLTTYWQRSCLADTTFSAVAHSRRPVNGEGKAGFAHGDSQIAESLYRVVSRRQGAEMCRVSIGYHLNTIIIHHFHSCEN